MRTLLCIPVAACALVACGTSDTERTTVPMVTTSVKSQGTITQAHIPPAPEPEHEFRMVPNENFILDGTHIFEFNSGGPENGYCQVLADTFLCSGTPNEHAPEEIDRAANQVQVSPEGLQHFIGDRLETSAQPVMLQPGEFTEIGGIRCSMMSPEKLICSGPGGTISIQGPEHTVNIEGGLP
ncbi:hypothetical protein [Corynebacterium freiburgense]|uniref:hypothetical protein n=1 Tax=Corynebacterium freiburgense TaxID=556548 RepID=UPI0004789B77|nr:hypothetical protein [Corynebacterium freiburgense]WJZ02231.1 hypothetical protein CFREI_04675 [Corynebacterium freiburgense]